MRRPRRHEPGQLLDITIRCHHSEFRLLPNGERRNILGFWLAKAQQIWSGVRVLAFCQMSNHLHLVVEDQLGQISDFMQYFLGHAAKRLNKLDQVRGALFERRFAEIVVLDHDALVQRVAYAVTNPVDAGLVRSHREWSGLCVFAGAVPARFGFTSFHERAYERACAEAEQSGAEVHREDFVEHAELEVAGLEAELATKIADAIDQREAELSSGHVGILGMDRVLEHSPFHRPAMSARSSMPLCFASTREVRGLFVLGWVAFVAAFREASRAFRSGMLGVAFPPFSFRPGLAVR